MNQVRRIYEQLLSAYGPQGWWPVTPPGGKVPRYCGGPRNERQQIEVAIGAVLTQNTSWKNVERAMAGLQAERLIDLDALLNVPEPRLARIIRPSGYYNQKAKKLKHLARFLAEHSLKELRALPLPKARELLLSVNGVGPETADSIILYALRRPIFVIDAYTRRIFSRLGLAEADAGYDDLQELFHRALRKDERTYNEYHALLVEHGKNVCRKSPKCTTCRLFRRCASSSIDSGEAGKLVLSDV